MADLESVLADVSYLMAMERSKAPNAKTVKKFALPDCSVQNVVHKHLIQQGQYTFEQIHTQRMGAHYLQKFIPSSCPIYTFLKAINSYERIASGELRRKRAKEVYDKFIFADMLAMDTDFPKGMTDELSTQLSMGDAPPNVFRQVKRHLCSKLSEIYMKDFMKSAPYVRFCQWKYMELITPQQLPVNVKTLEWTPKQISLSDFSIHRIIGRGGFGEVYGCRKDDSGRMFAMKLLDKKRIKMKKGEHLALNERNMLAKVDSPFVVNLYYAFQTADKLCFILDLMNGGDLHYHLTQHGVFSEDEVRFYAAELILALEHIHSQNVVYRDLKPSNILLDEQGHIRLSDLGLACDFKDHQPSSSVGTHGYMAPEVIRKGVQYTFTSDWFSLGCVFYKLLRGHSPFRSSNAKNKDEIDKQTLEKEVVLPTSFSSELSEMLYGLLQKDPGLRLGCKGKGSEELKELAFFKNTNWDDVLARKLSPPLLPPRGEVNAADAFDIGNFDDDDTKGVKVNEVDQKLYRKFNLLVPDRWQAELMEGIFVAVNYEKDKQEVKERQKFQKSGAAPYNPDLTHSDILLQGYGYKLGSAAMFSHWQKKFFVLYPNRLEWADSLMNLSKAQVMAFDTSILVEEKETKGAKAIRFQKIGEKKEHFIRFEAIFEQEIWLEDLRHSVVKSEAMLHAGPKMMRDSTSVVSLQHRERRGLRETKSLPLV